MPNKVHSYTRTFEDELDWKIFDQLHGAVSQVSSFCFETKKFCVTTEFVVLTLMVKFTVNKLDHSLFVTGLVIPLCFWFLDSVGYYYQVRLRGMMESIRLRLAGRNSNEIVGTSGVPIISRERIERSLPRRTFDAAINHSMWLYGLLFGIDLLVWALFATGAIQ